LDVSEHYVYGKNKRVIFLIVGKIKKSEKLEIVHTDVWRLVHVSFIGGYYYYVTFFYDATRKT